MNADRGRLGKNHRLSARVIRKIFAAGFALALLAPMVVSAQYNYDERDVRMLPEFCKYAQDFRGKVPGGNNPAEIQRWTDLLGSTYLHIHHYCYGLVDTNRATRARSPQERMHLLGASIGEFDYVIRHAPQDFVLLPEILTKKGENLIRLGQAPRGVVELQRAIGLKPDYWPPYAAMSDYFKGAGDLNKARETLEKGLSAAPDAKALQRRLAELGGAKGKKTAPGPAKQPAAPPSPPEQPAVPQSQPEPSRAPEPPAER
jgi:hypothetical protein